MMEGAESWLIISFVNIQEAQKEVRMDFEPSKPILGDILPLARFQFLKILYPSQKGSSMEEREYLSLKLPQMGSGPKGLTGICPVSRQLRLHMAPEVVLSIPIRGRHIEYSL